MEKKEPTQLCVPPDSYALHYHHERTMRMHGSIRRAQKSFYFAALSFGRKHYKRVWRATGGGGWWRLRGTFVFFLRRNRVNIATPPPFLFFFRFFSSRVPNGTRKEIDNSPSVLLRAIIRRSYNTPIYIYYIMLYQRITGDSFYPQLFFSVVLSSSRANDPFIRNRTTPNRFDGRRVARTKKLTPSDPCERMFFRRATHSSVY